jgi:glycosyltransferase involved in cell wall biosynthesis
MTHPKISVVMNCYNGETFLHEAVRSVVAQSFQDWELIFWDNCSTDKSADIINSYRDSRIKYFAATNHTELGEARKMAVERCAGEYLAFLDCDDLFLPDNLSAQLDAIQQNQAAVAYGGVIIIDAAGKERTRLLPRWNSGIIFGELLRQYEIHVPAMMIRHDVLKSDRLNFDENIFGSEEYCLMMQLAIRHPMAVSHRCLARLRFHRNSLTYAVMEKWASDRTYTLDKIRAEHPQLEGQFIAEFREAYARASYYRARWLVHSGKLADARSEMRKVALVQWRYFVLCLLLSLSPRLWLAVHKKMVSSRD